MDNAFVLIGIVAAIWIFLVLMQVPATVVFFSILVGQLLAVQLSDETYDLVTQYTSIPDFRYVQVALLLTPVVITILFLRGRVSKSKRLIEAVPLLLAAASITIFIDNYFAISRSLPTDQSTLLRTYESLVVSAGAVLSLVSAWFSYPKPHKDKKHKKH